MATETREEPGQTILVAAIDDDNGGEPADAPAEHAEHAKRGSVDEQAQGSPPSPDPSERPAKKVKRGKYISRACTSCQQRKIKCEGGEPCAQCIARKRQCVVSNHELLSRLVEVERRLNVMQNFPTPRSTELENVLEADGQTFAGEISMSPAFQDVDEGLGHAVNSTSKSIPKIPSGQSFSNPATSGDKGSRKVRGWLESVLNQHGVVANEEEWRRYLAIFMDEIHILYPILHRPTVWETFNELWEYSALWSMSNSADREQKRMSVALICFCLALGRCSVSTRMTDANGVHSAGWSLYSVGLALMQDTMEMSNNAAKSLVTMQILLLRVLYLFRLDATQRAVRVHALLVSNAHIVGLHRQSTYDKMPVFWAQMYCRTWWSIYVLDRRLAIESGRPYLIQDCNIDTALPLELGDDWLSQYSKATDTAQSLKRETSAEIASEPITPIPYLMAMVRFSRVVGKVWELMYGIKGLNPTSSAMVEYADSVLCNLLENVPKDLSFDPRISPDLQFGTRLRWQVKQTMLLFSCSTFLRLLIRRPFLTNAPPDGRTQDDELESDLILAATRSLNMYCHRIWVSGKTMRWVRKLTLIVQRTLNEVVSEERPAQSANGLQNAGGSNRVEESRSSVLNVDGLPHDSMVTENASMLSDTQPGRSDQTNASLWAMMEGGADNPTPELPEWAMLDFNFEAIINGDGMNPRMPAEGLSTIAEDDKSSSGRGGGLGMDFDIDHSIFGSLESTGVFDIDMDVDKAVMSLCNPTNGGY
ncbi:fungal-specific transcription factor domain-containing protein [Ilyonectria robusta]|uniref:fungal-specific transcription factor domain-containing protein n=1 Tax=Ilyonectria robusta TaxID=1079257 RepID=UPI001E8DA2F4|nr:fungal-specific transcription factor domain-containing protein [Ilyonectria robusta]KAH8688468.1 fungal-specific transcription factor domain-containing protein [Ilyonectria robusta]